MSLTIEMTGSPDKVSVQYKRWVDGEWRFDCVYVPISTPIVDALKIVKFPIPESAHG